MDHEPQWDSLINEETEENEADKLISDETSTNSKDDNEDEQTIENTVRSLLDSAPLSSVSEVTLNMPLETTPLLDTDNHSEHEH